MARLRDHGVACNVGGREESSARKKQRAGAEKRAAGAAETRRSATIADGRGVRHRVAFFRIDEHVYHTVCPCVRPGPD
jgi:hypothetical protein